MLFRSDYTAKICYEIPRDDASFTNMNYTTADPNKTNERKLVVKRQVTHPAVAAESSNANHNNAEEIQTCFVVCNRILPGVPPFKSQRESTGDFHDNTEE